MDRLVLGVIAVIGVHTAFVLYMATVGRGDQNISTARRAPAVTTPARPEPNVETELRASVTPAALENNPPSAVSVTPTHRVKSRTPRVNSMARLGAANRAPVRRVRWSKPVPAFPLQASLQAEGDENAFSDRVIVYKKTVSRPSPTLSAVAPSTADMNPSKQKKSFVSKLQYIYKKPWDLIKAIGSKLR